MKQTFEIPKGCSKVTIERIGNTIVTSFEEEFKDGDVLFFSDNDNRNECIAIIKEIDIDMSNGAISYFYLNNVSGKTIYNHSFASSWKIKRHATQSESQRLFDALARDGKQWNNEKGCIEDLKWKPKFREVYFAIGRLDEKIDCVWTNHPVDERRFKLGNCFKTEAECQEKIDQIKAILK